MTGILTMFRDRLSRLGGDRRGVGAVEFALIAPVLVVLYIGSLEVSVAMSVNKKIARAASTIADLVTQRTSVDKTFLATMQDVAESVVTPFPANGLKIKVTGIAIDSGNTATVAWSWDETGGEPYGKGSETTVPTQLSIKDTFLVRAEVIMDYDLLLILPGVSGIDAKTITMHKTYHLRQRIGDAVTCSDCGPATS